MPEADGLAAKRNKTEDPAVTKFRDYLRIRTVHPDPDYAGAVVFLQQYADELGLPWKVIEVHPGKPVVLMTWEGQDPSLPTILLNSHTDVVPVFPEHWRCEPFSADKTENGDIYARGTQDMKCVTIWYLEAIRRLKAEGKRCQRTIHLSFVPEEEVGGKLGMMKFIEHPEFQALNVAFALDEGLANPLDEYTVFYGERAPWWVRVKCTGNPGHGSRFIENTAAEKVQKVINSFLSFRAEEKAKLQKSGGCLTLGDVTTVNLTMLELYRAKKYYRKMKSTTPHWGILGSVKSGGVAYNVVPTEMYAGFDIRIAPTEDFEEFEKKIQSWISAAGEGITYEFIQKFDDQSCTSTDKADPWWNAFSTACENMGMKLKLEIFPAATDSRFLRKIGLPAIGFSPMNLTPILLHDHNEFLNEDIFLKGIGIYCNIIPTLGNVKIS